MAKHTNDFTDVIVTLETVAPQLKQMSCVQYVFKDYPDYTIKVTKPNRNTAGVSVNSVASITSYYKDKVVHQTYITGDTALGQLCYKLIQNLLKRGHTNETYN
jgi:hypothetical protein